jgi:hypothetical protein
MPEKICTNCRYYKPDYGMFGDKKDEGKCQLSGDKVRWNATCTKWKEK